MGVTVNGGNFVVVRAGEGPFFGGFTSGNTITLPASNPSNPRIDYIIIRVRDPGVDGATVTQSQVITSLQGAPAATPLEPAGQLTDGDLVLAAVTVAANASSVTSIADKRAFAVSRGGVTPYRPGDGTIGSYEGQPFWNITADSLDVWTGTAMAPLASPASWTQFTPVLFSSAGAVNLGPNGVYQGAYQLLGKNLRVRYLFQAFAPCNLGYGPIYTRLPASLYAANSVADHHGRAQLNTQPPGGSYSEWMGDAAVANGSNLVYAKFNKTFTDNTFGLYQTAAQQGQVGTGIPLLPGALTDPLRGLGLNIEVEVA